MRDASPTFLHPSYQHDLQSCFEIKIRFLTTPAAPPALPRPSQVSLMTGERVLQSELYCTGLARLRPSSPASAFPSITPHVMRLRQITFRVIIHHFLICPPSSPHASQPAVHLPLHRHDPCSHVGLCCGLPTTARHADDPSQDPPRPLLSPSFTSLHLPVSREFPFGMLV